MDKKERFSFRKYKVGLVSVLVGAVFLAAGAGRVSADELSKAAGVSQTDPASNIEQVVQATESSSTADFAQVASVETTIEASRVESTATASATADEVALASKTQETVSEELSSPAATSDATAVGNVANAQESSASSEVAEEIAQDVEASAASVSSEVVTEVTEKAQPEEQTLDSATPQSIDSDELITVPEAWESGYKGQGTIVLLLSIQVWMLTMMSYTFQTFLPLNMVAKKKLKQLKPQLVLPMGNGLMIKLSLDTTTLTEIRF